MKKAISAIIVVFFGALQLILPFTDPNLALWIRIVLIVVFTIVWAAFSAFADEISEKISRIIFGKNIAKVDKITIVDTFRSDIAPKATQIEQFVQEEKHYPSQLFDNFVYDNWAFIINYITKYCLNNLKQIDHKVVCTEADTRIASYRFTKIYNEYLVDVIRILLKYREKEAMTIANQKDFRDFDKMLNDIKNAFSKYL